MTFIRRLLKHFEPVKPFYRHRHYSCTEIMPAALSAALEFSTGRFLDWKLRMTLCMCLNIYKEYIIYIFACTYFVRPPKFGNRKRGYPKVFFKVIWYCWINFENSYSYCNFLTENFLSKFRIFVSG